MIPFVKLLRNFFEESEIFFRCTHVSAEKHNTLRNHSPFQISEKHNHNFVSL